MITVRNFIENGNYVVLSASEEVDFIDVIQLPDFIIVPLNTAKKFNSRAIADELNAKGTIYIYL